MTPQQYERIREIFLKARDTEPRQRAEYLNHTCGEDALVRAEVESLLANDEQADTFLRTPALGDGFALGDPELLPPTTAMGQSPVPSSSIPEDEATARQHPPRIGQYKILGILGEGGMGIVYRAQQESPRRTVALKVIKPGIESRQLLKRFEHESQVLGWLQHPGIAQVFEAGTADTGQGSQPFFAMELIQGQPLTRYAEIHQPDIAERLRLIARVCDAVHHAHQKGVIHRDLKPANILVDASGQPKVVDFGVARATDADIRTTTLHTGVGQLVGTIAYMSPEQVAGDPRALDTRSDVYSLGVITYELLTGRLPLDVAHKTIPQAVRAIAEEEPTSLHVINKALRGDVEAIVAKALEKEKDRRYQSALDLATDIRRYLSDQPIAARPVTTIYQLRKFARRNKALVAAVLIVLVALSGGLVYVSWERNRAVAAERLAELRRAEAEMRRGEAEVEAKKSQAINLFMQRMLSSVDPAQTLGRDVPFRAFLDRAAEHIETDLPDQPLVQATVHANLGQTYRSLGFSLEAESHLRLALATRRKFLGDQHVLTFDTMSDLALALQDQGRLAEALPLSQSVLQGRRRLLGTEHPRTILAMNNLGWILKAQENLKEAESLFRESLELRRLVSGDDHLETLRTMVNLASVLRDLGKAEEAEPLSRKATEECRRTLGDTHPLTLYAMRERVWLLKRLRRLEDAEQLARQSLELDRRVLGIEHPHSFHSMNNLAVVLTDQGKLDEAEALHQQVLDARSRILGEEHADTLASMNNLAVVYHTRRKWDQAEPLYTRVVEVRRRVLGKEHRETISAVSNLALVLRNQGKFEEAEPLFRQVLDVRLRTLGEEHPSTLNSMYNLAGLYGAQKRYDQVETLWTRMLNINRRTLGEENRYTLLSTHKLAWLYGVQDRHSEAEKLYRRALEGRRKLLGDDNQQTLSSLTGLVRSLIALGEFSEAEPLAEECYRLNKDAHGPGNTETQKAIMLLVDLYEGWGKTDQAAEYRAILDKDQPSPEDSPQS